MARDLGVEVARALKAGQGRSRRCARALAAAETAEAQAEALAAFVAAPGVPAKAERRPQARRKVEFHVGETKVTARQRECRILSGTDFTSVPQERLERAVRAFEAALAGEG